MKRYELTTTNATSLSYPSAMCPRQKEWKKPFLLYCLPLLEPFSDVPCRLDKQVGPYRPMDVYLATNLHNWTGNDWTSQCNPPRSRLLFYFSDAAVYRGSGTLGIRLITCNQRRGHISKSLQYHISISIHFLNMCSVCMGLVLLLSTGFTVTVYTVQCNPPSPPAPLSAPFNTFPSEHVWTGTSRRDLHSPHRHYTVEMHTCEQTHTDGHST